MLQQDILEVATGKGIPGSLSVSFDDSNEVRYLVVYDLKGNDLGKRVDLLLPENMDQTIDSRAYHEAIWHYFTSLIPAENRSYVTEFAVLSDGSDNILAGVSPTYDNPNEWTLKVDAVDAKDPYSLTYSLLHEYGHLLTLNASQVSLDEQVFFHPDDQALYDQAVASCPRYFTGEGCSNSSSYMDEFFNRYWSNFYAEWQTANNSQEKVIQSDQSDDFYLGHEDQFLTRYAATGPEEDIAESWAFFLLSPKPEPTSIANRKILFFYEYPALVALRQEILSRLCTSFPGS